MANIAPGSDDPAQAGAVIQSDLPYLCRPHAVFSGGVTWALTNRGISIDSQPPMGSGGRPITIGRIWRDYGSLVDETAATYGVPIELILAFIATESSGDPAAIRYEPGYVSDEATPWRVSIGLMQTLISTAREALDDPSIGRDFLLQPQGSIRAGTAYVAQQAKQTRYDPPVVACAYNAGSVIYEAAAGDPFHMVQYPFDTDDYDHRYIEFFNDCFVVLRNVTPSAPSFVALMRHGPTTPAPQPVPAKRPVRGKEIKAMADPKTLSQTFKQAHDQDAAAHKNDVQAVLGDVKTLGKDFVDIWPKAKPVVQAVASFVRFIPGLAPAGPVLTGLIAVADTIDKAATAQK